MSSDHFPTREMPLEPSEAPPESSGPSGFTRLLTVLTSPSRTFEAVARNPQPWVGLIALILTLGIGTATTVQVTGPEQMEAMLEGPFGDKLADDEDFLQKMEESRDPSVAKRAMAAVQGGLGGVIFVALGALFYWLASMMVGGKGGFRRTLDVVLLSGWVTGIGFLATIPLILSKGSSLDVGYSLAPLLGLFGEGVDTSSFTFRFVHAFTNGFAIWQLILLAIGLGAVHHLSRGKAWIAAAVPWVLGYGLSVAVAGMFG
jgi:hypothetical protein